MVALVVAAFGLACPCLLLARVWKVAVEAKATRANHIPKVTADPLFSIQSHESKAALTFISVEEAACCSILLHLSRAPATLGQVRSGQVSSMYMPLSRLPVDCTLSVSYLAPALFCLPRCRFSGCMNKSDNNRCFNHLNPSHTCMSDLGLSPTQTFSVASTGKTRRNYTLDLMTKYPYPA